ncbi:hypothetical protein [Phocaeicola barnesiae]
MKTTVDKIVKAYAKLGDVKVTTLEDKEVMKVIRMRKAMRPVSEDFNAFLEDVKTKFKPEGFEDTVRKAQEGWDKMTDSEKRAANELVTGYNRKVDEAVREEADREVEIEFEALSEDSLTKLMKENSLTVSEMEMLDL